jgi:drug/metabolite transporter (DMT)-like permease
MLGELLSILAVLTFVGSNSIFRKTEHEASPIFINFFRTLVGTITFFLIILVFGEFFTIFLLPWEIWVILIISFVFGQVIGDTAYFRAQKELGTTKALAVSMTFPLFTFILSLIFLNRPFDVRMIFSAILIGLGITIIGKYKIPPENDKGFSENQGTEQFNPSEINSTFTFKAISFGLLASLGWAIGIVLLDFAINEIDRIIQVEELSSVIGNVIRFPFALLILSSMIWREKRVTNKLKTPNLEATQKKSSRTWYMLIIGSIIGTSLGAYIYAEATRTAGASFMSLIATACPLFAIPITYLINKEKISKPGFLGVVITIFGVVLILI